MNFRRVVLIALDKLRLVVVFFQAFSSMDIVPVVDLGHQCLCKLGCQKRWIAFSKLGTSANSRNVAFQWSVWMSTGALFGQEGVDHVSSCPEASRLAHPFHHTIRVGQHQLVAALIHVGIETNH